jgi:hypothetical protein
MSKGGGSKQTVTTQNTPNPIAQGAYQNAVTTGTNAAQQPYPVYPGSLVAGFTPMQQAGFANINNAAGLAQPYISQAANLINASTSGINPASTVGSYLNPDLSSQFLSPGAGLAATAGQGINPLSGQFGVQNFMSPYTQNVVSSLENVQNQQNAIQQEQLAGQAAGAGAWGGDRAQIAQSVLAGQQALGNAPAIANALQSGYGQALNAAMQTGTTNAQLALGAGGLYGQLGGLGQGAYNTALQTGLGSQEANAWLASQGAFGMANLGNMAQNLGLSGANAQLQAGGLQQQLAQEELNVPYSQWQAATAYPFQIANFEMGLASPLSGQTTTTPGPSAGSQIFGAGLAGTGILQNTGAFGQNGWLSNAFSGQGGADPYTTTDASLAAQLGNPGGGFTTGENATLNPFAPTIPVARGGRIEHRQDGGSVDAGTMGLGLGQMPYGLGTAMPQMPGGLPPLAQAGLGAGNPLVSGQLNSLGNLPTEKLRELSVRFPPNSPQGSMIATMLRRRQMMPQSNPAMQGLAGGAQTAAPGMQAGGGVDDPTGGLPPGQVPLPNVGVLPGKWSNVPGATDTTAEPNWWTDTRAPISRFYDWTRHLRPGRPSGTPPEAQDILPGGGSYLDTGAPAADSPLPFSASSRYDIAAEPSTGPAGTAPDYEHGFAGSRAAPTSSGLAAGSRPTGPWMMPQAAAGNIAGTPRGPLDIIGPNVGQSEASGNVHAEGHMTSSGMERGLYQITDGTWKDFAGKAGVDLKQYPTAENAPKEIQDKVASVIPVSRWAPSTIRALQQAYPGIDITGTLGEANSSVASTEHKPAGLGQGNPITVTQTDTGQQSRGLAGGAPQQPADHSLLSGNGSELIAMGLGIMSGTSPFALTNIGQGALKGMEWSEAQKMRQATMELRAQQELWNRQHQAAMEDLTGRGRDIQQQRADTYAQRALDIAARANEPKENWSYVGTGDGGMPVLLNTKTGETRTGNMPIGMKPGEAARVANAEKSLGLRQGELDIANQYKADGIELGKAAEMRAQDERAAAAAAQVTGKPPPPLPDIGVYIQRLRAARESAGPAAVPGKQAAAPQGEQGAPPVGATARNQQGNVIRWDGNAWQPAQ